MDEKHFERAAVLELAMREEAIARTRKREAASHTKPEDFDGTCPLCGELIPEARVAAGYFVCVPCKERLEHPNHARDQIP